MPHQNVHSSTAPPQNAATDRVASRDKAPASQVEPRTYAADVSQSTPVPPAGGEVAAYMDDGDALGADGVQQGGTHADRSDRAEREFGQGPKTKAANQARLKGES